MMYKKIKDVDINYVIYGNDSKKDIVLLHGWGQNIEMMKPIGDNLQKNFRIIIIDLPGFGNSSEPSSVWSIYDYVEAVHLLLEEINVKNPMMIGHSFGGKISIVYASKYSVSKLVLLASPFCKEVTKLSVKTKILKSIKKVPVINKLEDFAKKHIGSTDYKNASKNMREILVNHVNLEVKEEASKIKVPTLLIWGTNDEAVPINRAYELEKLISDAGLVVYENCTHYAYLERLGQTINILNSFFKED